MPNQYDIWLEKTKGEKLLHDELESIRGKDIEIEDRFFRHLEFGTGGLRGVIGAGTNRMNIFTIKRASLGMANYLNKQKKNNKIVVSYDSRNFSPEFARASAEVFASNGIETFIFDTLQPTPVCSFAIRYLKCDAGVMVTASHNPKAYNGYKAYNAEGCQITSETADSVQAEIMSIEDYFSVRSRAFDDLVKEGKIKYIDKSVYDAFIEEVLKLSVLEGNGDKRLNIVYSPLNGTGNIPVREVLKKRGFNNIHIVKEQELPDGNFTTCSYPNPEERDALRLALELGEKTKSDLVLATDPDCDRVGIAVRTKEGFQLISGNEVGVLLTYYIMNAKKQLNALPKNPVLVKTIVSSELIYEIAKDFNAEVYNVLTGFKYIGEVITALKNAGGEDRFVFGFEESYGYLSGTHVRDKDAVNASMLIAEMSEHYLKQGKTLSDVLYEIYLKYGFSKSIVKSYEFKGVTGLKEMNSKLTALRAKPFSLLGGMEVLKTTDYLNGIDGLPSADVLAYQLDGTKVLIRPSGTEPKLKVYILAKADTEAKVQEIIDKILPELTAYFQ